MNPFVHRSFLTLALATSSEGLTACGTRERLELGSTRPGDATETSDASDTSDATKIDGDASTAPSDVGTTSAGPIDVPTEPSSGVDTTDTPVGPVRGQLIDFWGHPVPNVALDVGGVSAVTAADGSFEVDGVSEVYDVSLVVHLDQEARETYGWTYQGLTSRRVVLPVYRGLSPRRAKLRIDVPGVEPSINGRDFACGALALDGQHGHQAFAFYQRSMPVSVVWRGPSELTMNARGVFWEPRDSDCRAPTRFSGWQQRQVTLRPGDDVALAFDAQSGSYPITVGTLEGTVGFEPSSDGVEQSEVRVSLFLRFLDGGTLPISTTDVEDGRFSVVAPVVDDTSWIVAASRSGVPDGDYAVHYDRLTPSQVAGVELRPPLSPRLLQPSANARLPAENATFEWVSAGHVGVLMVTHSEAFAIQFVVTANDTVRLPDLSHLGFVLAEEEPYVWGVEVHAQVSTVDEWLGRRFPLDPFSIDFESPIGPSQGAGKFARSGGRPIVFADN